MERWNYLDLQVSTSLCLAIFLFLQTKKSSSQFELIVAITVCSTPGFAGFVRTKFPGSKLASALRSLLRILTRGSSRGTTQKSTGFNPNQPRSGQADRNQDRYYELSEEWLMERGSRARSNIKWMPSSQRTMEEVQNCVDVEQLSQAPRQVLQRDFIPRQAVI